MPLINYLTYILDPRLQNINYRPLWQILIWIEYQLFHSEASYYHIGQILIHSANALMILAIVWRLSNRWLAAFLAAVFYTGLPVISEAVFWIADQNPFATFLSMGAIFFWVNYLKRGDIQDYILAFTALILAFMSRESSIVLPAVFLLIDRMIVRESADMFELVRRYSLVAILSVVYLLIEIDLQSRGVFVNAGGYSFGTHILSNYAAYLAMLVFPWGSHPSPSDLIFSMVGLVFIGISTLQRNAILIFLVLVCFLGVGPVVLASLGPGARYLYTAATSVVILWGLVFEIVHTRWLSKWIHVAASVAIVLLVVVNATSTADAAAVLSETSRQARVPFRDIMRQHPMFPNDTRLFLVEPPYNVTIPDVGGMFFLRYGANVSVGGTYEDGRPYAGGRLRAERANLVDYSTAYVYYFDDTNRPVEIPVDRGAQVQSTPSMPAEFAVPIRLEGFEVTSSTFKKEKPLALILYWRATGQIDKDYTVFVHVVDSAGQIVAGVDGMPRSGKEKTSQWRLDQFTADAHIITVPSDVAVGAGYKIEVGLYYLPTMQRLSLVDPSGRPVDDKVTITPFEVME